ncbi:MAG: lysophospholipase [Spirochaetales bacterium]|nr:lysophospholipase [Spirochaetales bacterium]
MKSFIINSRDNKKLHAYSWEIEKDSMEAILLIVHGMAEHAKRYHEFALYLNEKKITVYSLDLRGHGETAESPDELGVFAEKNTWGHILEDIGQYIDIIHNKYPQKPIFILGHSMGSLLARDLISRTHEHITGCICTGTSGSPGIMGRVGLVIAFIHTLFTGSKAKSHLFNTLLFGGYNKSVPAPVTDFDWLSRDNEQVEKYINDSLCGFICSLSLYYELIKGAFRANSIRRIRKIGKDLPLLLLSGDRDPVGAMGKGVKKAYHLYKMAGMKNAGITLFKDYRHEILNETGNQIIYSCIYEWIKKILLSS